MTTLRYIRFLGLIFAGCVVGLSAQETVPDVPLILNRAAEYVAIYEDQQLGNVLARETYLQNATIYSGNGVHRRQQRRTESDFLIILVGTERFGIRKVNRVDGNPVKSVEPSLESMLDDSPQGVQRRIGALKQESSRYNIGPVQRNLNVPTFALKVVHRQEAPRFAFAMAGTDRIHGIQTVELKFQEQRAPTLVHGNGGQSLPMSGSIWIESATGRVLKTEFYIENPYSKPAAKGRVTVTYGPSKTLGILVPDEMKESLETEDGTVVSTANYSDFRSFNVEVKSEIRTK